MGRVGFARETGETIDLAAADPATMRTIRGNEIGMTFQELMMALKPVLTVGRQVADGLRTHKGLSGVAAHAWALDLLRQVHIPEPERRLDQYPHELSGGVRQRVVIATALAPRPKLIVADESVSALDVSVQAQVLNLLVKLQADLGLSFLFISHDMAVVERVSHHVAVMYLGRIVEIGPRPAVLADPRHPYTRAPRSRADRRSRPAPPA